MPCLKRISEQHLSHCILAHRDPIFVGEGDIDAARALAAEADQAELFLYPGDQHYFADSSLPSYDAEAPALLIQRVLDFLAAR